MDGLYKYSDTSPTTSTLTSLPILVDGQNCVCYSAYWGRALAFGIDLGGAGTVAWIQLYGKRGDETTPVSWYPNANEFAVYKSDNNSEWTHVEDFVMVPEDIHPVSGSCAYWILNFSANHTARYFKVLATAASGAAWNSDGGSIKVGQIIVSSGHKPHVQFINGIRSSGADLGPVVETGSWMGMPGRSEDAGLDLLFSQRFMFAAQTSAPTGQTRHPSRVGFAGQARTNSPVGLLYARARAQFSAVLNSSGARFGSPRPTRVQPGGLIRCPKAWLGKHFPLAGQILTSLRSRPAESHPFLAARMAVPARSTAAQVSGQIPTQIQLSMTLRASGRGIHRMLGRERLAYHLVEQGRLLLDGGFTASGRQRLGVRLTAGFSSRQRLVCTLAEASRQGRQTMSQMLEYQSMATGRQRVGTDLLDYDLQIIDPLDWDIFMDDISIKNRLIEPLIIIHDESGIHNHLTIESADRDLFQTAQPLRDGEGHSLVVRLGTRELFFVLTDRSGDQDRFTLTGLSKSVKLDHPYQTETSFNQDYEVLEFRQGQYEMTAGQVITGHISGACGVVISMSLTSGFWSLGTAQGRLYLHDVQGDFVQEALDTRQQSNAAFTDGYLTTISLARPASEVAREIAGDLGLVWEPALPDWVLPTDVQLEGYPIDIISELAHATGGIVRCGDDQPLLIRPRFPVRPIHLPAHTPAARYDRTMNMIEISLKETLGTQYNAIEVNGYSEEIILPQFEFEIPPDNQYQSGEDLFARVYWTTEPPEKNLALHWTTAGDVAYLGRHSERIQDELVLLEQGRASVTKPILDVVGIEWVGSRGWGVQWVSRSREIKLIGANENDISSLFRIAKMTYTSQYDRYRVKNHSVQALLLALEIPASPAVAVKVKFPAETEYPAEAIEAPLLTTTEAAVFRGQAELDRSSYHSKTVQFLAPYNPLVTDGVIVEINDDRLGLQGNFHVRQAQIQIHGPVILHRLECIQHLV